MLNLFESLVYQGFQHFGTLLVKGFMYPVKTSTMKTIITFAISSLLFSTALLGGSNISKAATKRDTLALTEHSAILPSVEEESYINDIPFDTEAIALKSLFLNLAKPEEEPYINDIPFATEEVVATYNYMLNNIKPEPEEYVDDIPFNTAEVAKNYINSGCQLTVTIENGKCIEL